jgi:hypothetical protein
VWLGNSILSERAYAALRELAAPEFDLPAYEDLKLWDSHDQNIVDVD